MMPFKRFPASEEYKRDPNLSKDVVQQILLCAKNQPHLPEITEEDAILFLSSCLYSIEVAKQTVDLYYTYRTHVPEIFSNRDPLSSDSVLNKAMSCYTPLPGYTHENHKVIFSRLQNDDLSKFSFAAEVKMLISCQDQMLYEDGALQGWRIVVDMSTSPAGVITRLSPMLVKKTISYFLEGAPVRLKGIHLVNPPSYVDRFVNIFRPLISRATANMIQIHSNKEELYKIIPKKMLPAEVDGDLDSCEILYDEFKKKLIENRDYFVAEEKLRVDETLRPGKAKSAKDLFGIEGSFRKLDID